MRTCRSNAVVSAVIKTQGTQCQLPPSLSKQNVDDSKWILAAYTRDQVSILALRDSRYFISIVGGINVRQFLYELAIAGLTSIVSGEYACWRVCNITAGMGPITIIFLCAQAPNVMFNVRVGDCIRLSAAQQEAKRPSVQGVTLSIHGRSQHSLLPSLSQ